MCRHEKSIEAKRQVLRGWHTSALLNYDYDYDYDYDYEHEHEPKA
jgi:hypothetical protein